MPRSALPTFTSAKSPSFREALSRFATGVTVVTGLHEKKPVGVTISSFAGVSLNPPLVLFCLDEKSSALSAFKKGANFLVHVLEEKQKHLALMFSRMGGKDWKKIRAKKHKSGAPLLPDSMAVLVCRLHKRVKAGDHAVIIGRVKEILINEASARPLLHTQRSYWALGKGK